MNIKNTLQADAKKHGKRPASHRPEDERLSVGSSFAFGFQHVLTMYGGIIAVPLIVGQAAGLSPADIGILIAAALFMGGLATLLQTIGIPFFGSQLPLVQGVSFASVATMVAIVSVGDPRRLLLRPRGGGGSIAVTMGHGDLVVMGGSCQRTWEHAVPKVAHSGPRISVQFRPLNVF